MGDKNIRARFKYGIAATHFKYFESVEEAEKATDTRRRYELGAIFPTTYYPTSKQIQKKGPRGGWSKI